MGEITGIQWCDHTFNIAWGCEKVSQGCKFCYAETLATRWGFDVFGPGKERRLLSDENWAKPLRWFRKAQQAGVQRKVFCSSMTDLFLDDPQLEAARARLWPLVEQTKKHLIWQFLTKRPENVMAMLPRTGYWRNRYGQLPDNVWVGATIEDDKTRSRIVDLLRIPAQTRFISYEPLLSSIPYPLADCTRRLPDQDQEDLLMCKRCTAGVWESEHYCPNCYSDYKLDWMPYEMIHMVIVGGESGPQARLMQEDWARQLRDYWGDMGVAYFFKQAGTKLAKAWGCSSKVGELLDEIPEEFRRREFPLEP